MPQDVGASLWTPGRVRLDAPSAIDPPAPDPADVGLDDAARRARSPMRLVLATVALATAMFLPDLLVEMVQAHLTQINETFNTSQIEWVQTSTLLTSAVTVLPLGKIGDIYGKRLVLLIQCAAIVLGGVLCATTHDFAVLLLGRVIQGLGCNLVVQVYGLVRDIFPRRWIPVVAGATGAMFCLAPLATVLGSWVGDGDGYAALFWMLTAIAGLAGLLVLAFVPETPLRTRERLDWPGIGLISTAVFALTYGLNEVSVPARGWTSVWTIGFLLAGAVIGVGWLYYLNSSDQTLITQRLLLGKGFRRFLGTSLPMGLLLAMGDAVLQLVGQAPKLPARFGPGYGLGLDPADLGRYLLIGGCIALAVPFVAAWYAQRHGLRLLLGVGAVLVATGITLVTHLGSTGATPYVLESSLYYAGDSMIFVAIPLVLMQSLPAHYQGIGGGTYSVLSGFGVSLGSQLLVVVMAHNVFLSNPVTGQTLPNHAGVETIGYIVLAAAVLTVVGAALIPGLGRSRGGALPNAALDAHQVRTGVSARV